MGYIRKCITSWTNGFLLSIQQRSVCQASFTHSETCDSDLPYAESEGRLPHVHGQTYNSQFAVLCMGLFLLLGIQIIPTKIAVNTGISYNISIRWQFLMKSKTTPLASALTYSPNIVPVTTYLVEDNVFPCFTFILPCLVTDFFSSNQPDALINQIYSVIKLYMFRASSLPIIRSFLL